jgi:crossover junction endodeoxyribonuclease RusA
MKEYVVRLPWPDRKLHPNARVHWGAKNRATKTARTLAYFKTLEAGAGMLKADGFHVKVEFFPPDRRRRDRDGMYSSCKAYFDGIADATKVDDSEYTFEMTKREPVRDGEVRLTIQVEVQ